MGFVTGQPELIRKITENVARGLREVVAEKEIPGDLQNDIYRPREIRADESISSDAFNREQQAIYRTLRGLHSQANAVSATALQRENAISEGLRMVRSAVYSLRNQIRSYGFLRAHPEFDTVRFLDFDNARNLTDRAPMASIDTETRVLRLAPVRREVARVASASHITIRHIGGGSKNGFLQDFGPEKMVDEDDNTFWADLIVTDGPIRQSYTLSDGRERICNGLVTEIEIPLSDLATLNGMKVLPFGEHPVSIIDLAYREGNVLDRFRPIPGFSESRPNLDWTDLSFVPIRASTLKIVLLQENYVSGIYHLPARMVRNTNILDHAIATTYLDRVGDTSAEVDTERVSIRNELVGYLEMLSGLESQLGRTELPMERVNEVRLVTEIVKQMADSVSGTDTEESRDLLEPFGIRVEEGPEEFLSIATTEYLTGIRTLRALHTQYAPVSYYTSPDIDPGGSPVEISVAATEDKISIVEDDGVRLLTSIEYDLDIGEGYSVPLLPVDAPSALDEVLFVDRSTRIGRTRFLPKSSSLVLRKDGAMVSSSTYTVTLDEAGLRAEITITSGYSATALYTVSYAPTDEAWILDLPARLTSTPLREPEAFPGTGTESFVRLKYPVYIAQEIVNDETDWVQKEASGVWEYSPAAGGNTEIDGITYSPGDTYEPVEIYVGGTRAVNITDYTSELQPAFTNLDLSSGSIEFLHVGRNIYFAAPLSSPLTVSYRWMVQHLQLKATLRCLKRAGSDVTPAIRSASLRVNLSGV